MKKAVITGSARGLGLEMAKVFRKNNVNVLISDLNENNLEKSKKELEEISSLAKVAMCRCDVTRYLVLLHYNRKIEINKN